MKHTSHAQTLTHTHEIYVEYLSMWHTTLQTFLRIGKEEEKEGEKKSSSFSSPQSKCLGEEKTGMFFFALKLERKHSFWLKSCQICVFPIILLRCLNLLSVDDDDDILLCM